MIVIENADLIEGDSTVAAEVDFQIYGLDNNVLANLADGQLANAKGTLYTANSTDVVTAIILVNTGAAHNHVNLYHKPSAGTSRRLIPKDLQLEVGYSLHWEGSKCVVLNLAGAITQTIDTTLFLDDTAGGTDALITKAPTSNAMYDGLLTKIPNSVLTEWGSIIFRNATIPAELLHGTDGQVLTSGGHGADPAFENVPGAAVTLTRYTASDTWTKPTGCLWVLVDVIAGGGGGGGGNTAPNCGAGGGGGARFWRLFHADMLGATETITIGDGGTSGASNNNGGAGGTSSFGAFILCTGGGGGLKISTGGIGGTVGGYSRTGTPGTHFLGATGGAATAAGVYAEYGGAGGAGGGAGGGVGGAAFLGGGAGGGGGAGTAQTGVAGGNSYIGITAATGGGGAGGAIGSAGTAGTCVDDSRSGTGGGGGGGATSGTGKAGGAGGVPGGGGGGGGSTTGGGDGGGAGGKGEVRVWSW